MRGWKQGDGCLAVQESRDCFDLISDVVICGIYLSLASSLPLIDPIPVIQPLSKEERFQDE